MNRQEDLREGSGATILCVPFLHLSALLRVELRGWEGRDASRLDRQVVFRSKGEESPAG